MGSDEIWEIIVEKTGLTKQNLSNGPFYVTHRKVKQIVSNIDAPNNRKDIRIHGY